MESTQAALTATQNTFPELPRFGPEVRFSERVADAGRRREQFDAAISAWAGAAVSHGDRPRPEVGRLRRWWRTATARALIDPHPSIWDYRDIFAWHRYTLWAARTVRRAEASVCDPLVALYANARVLPPAVWPAMHPAAADDCYAAAMRWDEFARSEYAGAILSSAPLTCEQSSLLNHIDVFQLPGVLTADQCGHLWFERLLRLGVEGCRAMPELGGPPPQMPTIPRPLTAELAGQLLDRFAEWMYRASGRSSQAASATGRGLSVVGGAVESNGDARRDTLRPRVPPEPAESTHDPTTDEAIAARWRTAYGEGTYKAKHEMDAANGWSHGTTSAAVDRHRHR